MNELFLDISEGDKALILQAIEATSHLYEKNKIILSNVKRDKIICIILSGHIQIVRNDINGNRTIIEDLKDGDLFGSISSHIASPEYEIYTRAATNLVIIDFNNIIACNSNDAYFVQFIKNLLNIMHDKIDNNNNRIEVITSKTIRDKLLSYFSLMAQNSDERLVHLPFSYSELADYLAINRSAMTRELKALKEEGFIEIKNRLIKLLYDI